MRTLHTICGITFLSIYMVGCGELPLPTTSHDTTPPQNTTVDQSSDSQPAPTVGPPLPPPTVTNLPPPASAFSYTGALSALWANEGGYKVPQDDVVVSTASATAINTVWDGERLALFGARNEVINAQLILEAANTAVPDVTVSFNALMGPDDFTLRSSPAAGAQLFEWLDRQIELFYVRYLQIKGIGGFCCQTYDERHIPKRMQRPHVDGVAHGTWLDRPDHDKHYPDIAVPLELHPTFDIAAETSQAIWIDIYIPSDAPAGLYTGHVTITEGGTTTGTVPIELTVYDFALPDTPSAQTMLYIGYADVNDRYLGEPYPYAPAKLAASRTIFDRHFALAHRHKISLIDSNYDGEPWDTDAPNPAWWPRLDGSLFSAAHGYEGPGIDTGNGVFSIGSYGSWGWACLPVGDPACTWAPRSWTKAQMWEHTDNWVTWFATHAPDTEYFLYLIDESIDLDEIESWASWMDDNTGVGGAMRSLATGWAPDFLAGAPSLDIPTSVMYVGDTVTWQTAADVYQADPDKRFYMYNSGRPASGSFVTEDDGVALRELAWGHYKQRIDRWFYWKSTYYNNFQAGDGETNVFQQAKTFGASSYTDAVLGESGWNHSNGDGVLFYPGTDTIFPEESYGIAGPIASLRLKYWRRGIQDVDYVTLAAAVDPACVATLVEQMVPKALWEYGIETPLDPTYVLGNISWSIDPNDWEAARALLAELITTGTVITCTIPVN